MQLPDVINQVFSTLLVLLPLALWVAWCLWCVNWQKAWVVLAEGAWAGVVLAGLIAALVWAQIGPSTYILFDTVTIPNFWWQLSCVTFIVLVALFCGWFQGICGWMPMEVNVEPIPEPFANHGHDDSHGHEITPVLAHGNGHGH
jgi:hypothetical protein